MDEELNRRISVTAEMVAAYVSKNTIDPEKLPYLITSVFQSLSPKAEPVSELPIPAVPIKRSVFPDYIICLEDGKKLKMLKRHLNVAYGMTPEQYRAKWGLPVEYPMVAPNYANRRSELAREMGLGREITAAHEPKIAKRGRRRKGA
ncbi:Putative mucR family transcriptional regulatory protein [Gluconacetobacter sp. SXCC-1]|nr:Putative mucR family transcriptional regulatory protein [Gluconacetobacter sp. SXCC-1]